MANWTTHGIAAADSWSMHDDGGTGWWLVMTLGMVAFWAAVIGLIYLLVRRVKTPRNDPPDLRETPRDILDRRFAEGDLAIEEYQLRRELLDSRVDDATGPHERSMTSEPAASR